MNRLYCTICCKEKRTDEVLLPAIDRYISKRISKVFELAKKDKVPFVILSGKYGLVKPVELIPYYDHLLKVEEVELLTKKVLEQFSVFDIKELIFFAKPKKENWTPYYEVLENATKELGIKLIVREMK